MRFFKPLLVLCALTAVATPSAWRQALQATATPIYTIQGTGDVSPLLGQSVTIEGVVTGDFQGNGALSGFYLQEAVGDGNPATSDGIFVYQNPKSALAQTPIAVGDRVRVAGQVEEYHGQTQIGHLSQVEVVGQGQVPAPAEVALSSTTDLERDEGMLVRFSTPLVVTGQDDLERYGSLTLAPERLFAPTNEQPLAQTDKTTNQETMLVLDDGSNDQSPKPTPYLDAMATRRTGATVKNLVGILAFDFKGYRLHPTQAPVFEDTNPRPDKAPSVGGELKIAGANIQNYWTTFKSETNPDARGANGPTQFKRQSQKVVAMLKGLDADVVGLMELENNGSTAIDDLVGKLNAAYGQRVYTAVADPSTGTGTDKIKVGLIYKADRLTPIGPSLSATDEIFNRFPVAQTFRDQKSGGVFTVVVNHLKSKGSCPDTGDTDKGEGCWTERRNAQAQALLRFIQQIKQSSGDNDVLALGDFNAYIEETPIQTLRAGGLKHLNLRLKPQQRYSFSYNNQFGSLDHAFATPSLDAQITGFDEWHINSDEPFFLEYSRVKPANFQPNLFRASDHDPCLIGLNLKSDELH